MKDSWKSVVGYEGYYEINTSGDIRSIDRYVKHRTGSEYLLSGKPIKHRFTKSGHAQVNLYKKGKRKTEKVHSLLALTFIGPKPKGLEVRHLDDNPKNNHISNILYGTRKENHEDRKRNGIEYQALKKSCPRGHLFLDQNLVPSCLPRRACLSCHRACSKLQTRKRRKGIEYSEMDIQNQSDINYQGILNAR